MLPGVSTSTPDGTGYGYDDPEAVEWWRTATLAGNPHLAPAVGTPPRTVLDHPAAGGEDLLGDVRYCQSILESKGFDVLVLEQTRPDVGMPVVKVVAPGLRHFWARFAPGRLYDVPVELGWVERPLAEEELNPVAIFI